MRNQTRLLYNSYMDQIARINGVDDARAKFSVAPAVEQKLIEITLKSSEFLSRVGIVPVTEQEGDKVGLGVTRPIASRTNTAAGNRRTPTDPTDSSDLGRYRCEKTDFDTAIKYAKLDAWAHRPEFQTLLRDSINRQKALDRIMIGFNGTSVAAATDLEANPLLQDVNKGWLHQIRTFGASRVLDHGDVDDDKIYIDASGTIGDDTDYVNLDALVFDAIEMLDEWYRDSTDLVVIVGRDLVHDKYFNLINAAGDKATEQEARDRILASSKAIGGLPAARVPFFPPNSLLITSYDNIPLYVQTGTSRRQVKDEPALDQIENYESNNEAYVVEDYGKCALVENIQTSKAAG